MARSETVQGGGVAAAKEERRQRYVALSQVAQPNPAWTPASGGERCVHLPPGSPLDLTDDEALDLARHGAIAPVTVEAEAVLKTAVASATARRVSEDDARSRAMETAAALAGTRGR